MYIYIYVYSLLAEAYLTEVCGCFKPGFSQFAVFLYRYTISTFIHFVPQSTTCICNIKKLAPRQVNHTLFEIITSLPYFLCIFL